MYSFHELPFPGPLPYTARDWDRFFGRDAELRRLAAAVNQMSLTAILAPSACGKTSLIQAGLVAQLRRSRLSALASRSGSRQAAPGELPSFPIVIRDWKGRTEEQRGFLDLLDSNIQQSLAEADAWYSDYGSASDDAAIHLAVEHERTSIREAAIELESANTGPKASRVASRRLAHVAGVLVKHLRSALVVFDQFEEALNDPSRGDEASSAVAMLFDAKIVGLRQLLSLRLDFRHLLGPLERSRVLTDQRTVYLNPMTRASVSAAMLKAADRAKHPTVLEPACLDALLDELTDHRTGEIELLTLQCVLNRVFRDGLESLQQHEGADQPIAIDARAIAALRRNLARSWGSGRGRSVDLRSALQGWIDECVTGSLPLPEGARRTSSNFLHEPSMRPMAARLADSLVSYANTKRPARVEDLFQAAFRNDVPKQAESRVHAETTYREQVRPEASGIARREGWDDAKLEQVLEDTCAEVLERLHEGGVLKRESASNTYELVHDGFSVPFRQWSASVLQSPLSALSRLYSETGRRLHWERWQIAKVMNDQSTSDPSGPFSDLVWRACVVDFMELQKASFVDCDFDGSLFYNCAFKDAGEPSFRASETSADLASGDQRPRAASMRNVTFRGCLFVDVSFEGVDLTRAAFEGCRLVRVRFGKNTNLDFATFQNTRLRDCVFDHSDNTVECSMRTMVISNDCPLDGRLRFVGCDLSGSAFASNAEMLNGRMSFDNCNLAAAGFRGLPFGPGGLTVSRSRANGVLFEAVTFDSDRRTPAGRFSDSNLDGALFLDCRLSGVQFERGHDAASPGMAVARTMTIRSGTGETVVGPLSFRGYGLDGLRLVDALVTGDVTFDKCSVLRAEFAGLRRRGESVVDLRRSDVLYARLAQALADQGGDFIQLTSKQKVANQVPRQSKLESDLRYRPLPAEGDAPTG